MITKERVVRAPDADEIDHIVDLLRSDLTDDEIVAQMQPTRYTRLNVAIRTMQQTRPIDRADYINWILTNRSSIIDTRCR